jgi:hypothetical protein
MTSRANQYRQLAHDFHFMARSLPHGQNRSTLMKIAEECERLADQCERVSPRAGHCSAVAKEDVSALPAPGRGSPTRRSTNER